MATVARNKQDVDNMTSEQRIWDSLNNSYGVKREASDQAYDQAISQADRQALSRGMQRSSYNNQVIGNLLNQKTKAQNDIYSEQIGEYEKWLQNRQETQEAREYQTAEREAEQAWQSGENALNRQQSQSQFDIQMAFNRDQAAQEQANWEKQFGYNEKTADQQIAMTYAMNIIQNGGDPSDDLLARAGLSRNDANAMKAQASGSGKGSTGLTAAEIAKRSKEVNNAIQSKVDKMKKPTVDVDSYIADLFGTTDEKKKQTNYSNPIALIE